MHINGRRYHLGLRLYQRQGPSATVQARTLPPRPSPDPELVVVWYTHRDAPSLLPYPVYGHEHEKEKSS